MGGEHRYVFVQKWTAQMVRSVDIEFLQTSGERKGTQAGNRGLRAGYGGREPCHMPMVLAEISLPMPTLMEIEVLGFPFPSVRAENVWA